ncbi:hypothetical protein [Alicyclobacillus sp.]|uniref:hypothetical protein n=1 Tax=Alicyclobacillus sp. TaxID=61169 RepID=UPI0025C17BB1|nr:hypothetical protein [Alicyclobacillus sp.]MCL6516393.1 hypothetical protein [Alicyclobacillus sp.]
MPIRSRFAHPFAPPVDPAGSPHSPSNTGWPPILDARWLPPREVKPVLNRTVSAWRREASSDDAWERAARALAAIRHEFWLADCGHQPAPRLAVGQWPDGRVAGLLAGWARPALRDFFIAGIALHPSLRPADPIGLRTAETLLTCAMDASIEAGCGGWIACLTGQDDDCWRALGFVAVDPFTLRRLGYFQRGPLQ